MDQAKRLRELLSGPDMLVVPGCYDPLGARVIEELGFPAAYIGGFSTGAHLVHTEAVLQMNDQVEAAARITKILNIPLLADAHAGWGDGIHTIRTVREFEHAGVAGMHIEDQVVPKRASYFRNIIHVLPRDVFIQKMKYAVEARTNPNTVMIGRTDAFSAHEGSDAERRAEAIARSEALMEAGCDMVFLRGVTEPDDMAYFCKAMPDVPQFTITHGDHPVDLYRQLGFRMLTYPTTPAVVAYDALKRTYASLRETGLPNYTRKEYWSIREALFNTLPLQDLWKVEEQTVEEGNRPHTPFIPELAND